jgi:hypothetical protein
VHLLLLTLLVADVVLAGGWRPALLLYPLLGFGFLRLRAPRLRRRVAAAREANAALAAQLQLPAVSVEMPARAFFRPDSRLRRRLTLLLVVVLAALIALGVAATVWAIGQTHRWAREANRICAREQARVDAQPLQPVGAYEAQSRANAIERDALTALGRLPARTRVEKEFVAWRRYELELDGWLLGRIAADDRAGVALGRQRARTARESIRRIAERLGARACARR